MKLRYVGGPGFAGLVVAVLVSCAFADALAVDVQASAKAAPQFQTEPPTGVLVKRRYTYRAVAVDATGGRDVTITAPVLPAWLTFRVRAGGKAVLKGKADETNVGVHEVTLAAFDSSKATVLQHFTIEVLLPAVQAPVLEPAGGRGLAAAIEVVINAPETAAIRYTTDGTVPTATHGLPYTGPVRLEQTTTLAAVAIEAGHMPSRTAVATYAFCPLVTTLAPTAASGDGASLTAAVNPRGLPTKAWFEWSTSPALTRARRTRPEVLPAGSAALTITSRLEGLTPGQQIYYRVGARGKGCKVYGLAQALATEPLDPTALTVNSLGDEATPAPGHLTLRAAVERVSPGGVITFGPLLNGRTIELTTIGEAHSGLKGEVFMMAGGWVYLGYRERDYGASALYARKDLTLDASALPAGVGLHWGGTGDDAARVLCVRGNLTMRNVTVSGGRSVGEPIWGSGDQPYTLARGGGVAVWGRAVLEHCVLYGNQALGDVEASRDRGAFGGGIYGDSLVLSDCIVSGNRVSGYGAAGGGVYSVGGAEWFEPSLLERSCFSGNRVTGQHAYGGGVYSDGGGRGNRMSVTLRNCTIARNLVEDHPDLTENPMAQYYYRGGGFYMSNGLLVATGCTIAENAVTGVSAVFNGKPNMGGGGIAATIGDAHVVESMELQQCLVAGNLVAGVANDVYTGSLIEFLSYGYNRIGVLDFSQILVPIPAWQYLSRRHWPKVGDQAGIGLGDVLDVSGAIAHGTILSAGPDAGAAAVLWYPPLGLARDQVPPTPYYVPLFTAGYVLQDQDVPDDFLNYILEALSTHYGDTLGGDFGDEFGDMTGVVWGGDAGSWPSDPQNIPWIAFWHALDLAIGDRLGAARIGDDFWGRFSTGLLGGNIMLTVTRDEIGPLAAPSIDQLGRTRAADGMGDIGAIEVVP